MKRKTMLLLLGGVLILTLCGCLRKETYRPDPQPKATTAPTEATVETAPQATVPADGDPENVTCKGSYTANENGEAVIATAGNASLTNETLWAWYWAAVAEYRQAGHETAPDFEKPLDTQVCQIDDSVGSWQQYFLKQALSGWHSAQALQLRSLEDPIPTEAAYQPNAETHERCMTGIPATKFLYGYDEVYEINTMHQAFLDGIPEMLASLAQERGFADAEAMAREAFGVSWETLAEFVRLYNYAYMYHTYLSYSIAPTTEETESWFTERVAEYEARGISADGGSYVDIRQLLLIPDEKGWAACEEEAKALLKQWQDKTRETEATFAQLAHEHSQDTGSAASGGLYRNLRSGQLLPELDAWCFDLNRKAGDTAIISTEQGVHILYFVEKTPIWRAEAERDLMANAQEARIREAKERFPAQIDYSAITLAEGTGTVSWEDVLYPDVAHERYPEVPLYLQQDYPNTWFGNYKISSHGCGITTFAMLSTYMSDEEWTPPEMCALYGQYSFENGTDGMIFINESPKYGYFFLEKTYDPNVAKEALAQGHIVVSIQHKGYWTSGGHYILFEKLTEDGMVQVRDSNIANYMKLPQHKEDKHTWFNSTYAGSGYWIFDYKVTRTPACSRCGSPEEVQASLLRESYLCEKCAKAQLRRSTWLSASVE